jgi:2-keto-4-pentenoate hydratase/2-oxohepta-3-ene-1,7-dioic acid hydratase in catechol pathway
MRIANVDRRLKLLVAGGAVDVETASRGRFSADPRCAIDRIDELASWSAGIAEPGEDFSPASAGPPVPAPQQVFAIGLNYVDHAIESGLAAPKAPVVFAKYVTSLTGPVTDVVLPDGSVDWEVEVVAVIGRVARRVPVERAWECVAGLMVGQDISERQLQHSGPAPQFGLAKSFPGFSPTGPVLVTPDELDRPDDLGIGCALNGEEVQKARTSEMTFTVPALVAYLSAVLTLLPGDLIFTGTPPGVGMGRTPPRFLHDGDRLRSWVEGIGELEQRFVAPSGVPEVAEDHGEDR